MNKRKVLGIATLICIFLFSTVFGLVLRADQSLIMKKDLYSFDESVNSVVSANVTRKFFPPMVRVNPLVTQQGHWMEGPYWQHIPALFTYVPLPFFLLDGKVTIEVKRLSYAFLLLIGGIGFIYTVYRFDKRYTSLIAATLAAVCWVVTPFTRNLVTGLDFGTSDILLVVTIIGSFAALCWYLKADREVRRNYSRISLLVMSAIVALPIITKSLLGAIPAATFFVVVLHDQKKFNSKFIASIMSFMAILIAYYGAFYMSSPETFKAEIFVPLYHVQNYEGWARPWYTFLTDYLPHSYLHYFYIPFILSIVLGAYLLYKRAFKGKTRNMMMLALIWFVWNLAVASVITSKAPNFIFQTYLFGLFFGWYSIVYLVSLTVPSNVRVFFNKKVLVSLCTIMIIVTVGIYTYVAFSFKEARAAEYSYDSLHEKYYHFAEVMRDQGANTQDLFILNSSRDDCWIKYYMLFLTGSETKTFQDVYGKINIDTLRKYNKINIVLGGVVRSLSLHIPYSVNYFERKTILTFKATDIDTDFFDTLKTVITKDANLPVFPSEYNCNWQ